MTRKKITHPDDGAVRWLAAPPERKGLRRNDWTWLADHLRTRPGVWAEVAQIHRQSWALPIRSNGLIDQLKKQGCEVRLRNDKQDITHIYARWSEGLTA
jgi:uncharacterized protein YhdP